MTGDLCKRKIIPALYRLLNAGQLNNCCIIGAAREHQSVQDIVTQAREFIDHADDAVLEKLMALTSYMPCDITNNADIDALQTKVIQEEQQRKLPGNRIIYCAVSSSFFCTITAQVARVGLMQKKSTHETPWHRIVYEKPFGTDLISAQEINRCIATYLNEHQIYRIDHYLLKEFVSNIALVRFTNCVFEPLWNNRYIDAVHIILSETVGIGDRGLYYDAVGAVADVMQNHMLEILALLAMEAPEKLTGEHIRSQRAKVLSAVKATDGLFGYYQGYRQEKNVAPDSTTETFALARLHIENPRWAGVPFYLKTGKYLQKKQTIIHIQFKQVECLLTRNCPSDSNYLTMEISPESVMTLSLNVKKPGLSNEVVPVAMEFNHRTVMAAITPEAYELLFEEIARGEESVSVRFDEIESAWRIIEQLRALNPPLYEYQKHSTGPEQANEWALKQGMRWRS